MLRPFGELLGCGINKMGVGEIIFFSLDKKKLKYKMDVKTNATNL
jgi:hypothetical protein